MPRWARQVAAGALSWLILVQPLLAQSAGIEADGAAAEANRPGLDVAANGVPVVNIVTPNDAGVSHNKYSQFNVDTSGAILNNAKEELSQSQLGGLVQGNANLADSAAASLILNEITSTNRSLLEGAVEVHGAAADVVLANPNGITCNGCGFINTPRVTLATGTPELGDDGALENLQIEGGDIAIGAAGADLQAADIFDLMAGRIRLAGAVRAGGVLNLIAGRNSYGYASGLVTALTPDGSVGGLAIDSTLLGGMYAGRIRLLSTGVGAGVRLLGPLSATAEGITLTADGQLVLADAQAAAGIEAASVSNEVQVTGAVHAGTDVVLDGETAVSLEADAVVAAAGDVTLDGETVTVGSGALAAAGVDAEGVQSATGILKVTAATGTIQAGAGLAIETVGGLTNSGTLASLTTATLQVDGAIVNSGSLLAEQALVVQGLMGNRSGTLTNKELGVINGGAGLTIEAASLSNAGTAGSAEGAIYIELAGDLENTGLLYSGTASHYRVDGTIANTEGDLLAETDLTIEGLGTTRSGAFTNSSGTIAAVTGDLTLRTASITNDRTPFMVETTTTTEQTTVDTTTTTVERTIDAASADSGAAAQIQAGGGVVIETGALTNRYGTIGAVADMSIAAQTVTNTGQKLIETVTTTTVTENPNGTTSSTTETDTTDTVMGRIRSGGMLTVTAAGALTNSGAVVSQSAELRTDGAIVNRGLLQVDERLVVGGSAGTHSGAFTNTNAGTISSGSGTYRVARLANAGSLTTHAGSLTVDVTGELQNSGSVSATTDATLAVAGNLTNTGTLTSVGQMTLAGRSGGHLGTLMLGADSVTNGAAGLTIRAAGLSNAGAAGSSAGAIDVALSGDLSNTGLLYSGISSSYRLDGTFTNTEADIIAETDLTIAGLTGPRAGALTNSSGLIEAVGGDLTVRAASVTNQRARFEVETTPVAEEPTTDSVVAACRQSPGLFWHCGGKHSHDRKKTTQTTTTTVVTETDRIVADSAQAQMLAGDDIVLEAGSVDNSYSQIEATGDITISAAEVHNRGREVQTVVRTTTVTEHDEWHCSGNHCHGLFGVGAGAHIGTWTDPPVTATPVVTAQQSVYGTIRAGGELDAEVTGYLENNAVTGSTGVTISDPDAELAEPAAPDEIDRVGDPQVDAEILAKAAAADLPRPQQQALPELHASIDALLGRGALFVEVQSPQMPYLIETRAEFVDPGKYLGSDYFLERVGMPDPEHILKRLGDAYVETRLIRDQLFSLTGYRFLGGARDDRAQMQALYDNAIDAYQSLKLTIGVALSPSQIASLGNDIIWLERRTIQGQAVLVPRLYLAASTLEGLDLSSARIAGSETVIKSAYLVNTGAIVGTDALTLETTQDLFNQGGSLLSDGTIDMDVGGLFANRAGTVSGGGIVDIAADSMLNTGSITGAAGLFVETTSDLLNEGGSLLSEGNIGLNVGGLFANRDGTVSGGGIVGITADSMVNTGAITGIGGLAVQTVNNLLNWGGSLRSEGDIGLNVGGQFANRSGIVAGGGNVSISAAEILNETEVTRERTGDGFVDRIGQVATIAAGGELNLQADGAIRSIGGALKSGGDTTLNAGGDIEIAAVELQSEQRRSTSGGQDNRRSVTHELATIETGGNLQVTAGGDLTVRGATVEAGGDATLYAEGDTTIESVQDRRWSATRQGSDRRSETSTETQRTTISAGGELTVGARTGDVTLDAVSLVSGGDTNLVAEQGTVLLLTETDEAGSTRRERQVRRLEWSETNQGRSDETIEHVELEYGGELRISAGEGVVVEYERDGSLSASLNELTDSPELAWMDQLRGEANVEWQGVEASSESWYRSSSGLTAAGKAAAAQAAAESQKSVAGSEDPGVSSLRVYGAGLPSAAGGGGGGGQLLAGVQGVPRNTIRPLPDPQPKDSSGSESGSSQGGTTGGSDTSTLTLKTVDITEPAPLPYDPYAPWLFGSGYTTHPSGEGTTETVTIGLVDIELPTSNTGSDGNGAGGGYDFWSEFYTTGTGTSAGSGRDGQQTSVLPWLSPWSIGGFLAPLGGFGLTAGWVPGSGDPAPGGGVMHPPVGQGQGRDLIDLSGGQDATGADLIDLSGGFVGIGQDLPEFEIPQTGADVIRLTGDDVGIGQDLPGTIEIGDPGAEFCTFMSWYCPQLGPEAGSETPGLTIYANEPAGQEGQNAQGGGQETVSSGRATDPTQTGQPSDTSSNGDQGTAAVNEYGDASGGGQNVADGGNQSTWTSTGTKTGIENAVSHWNKHEDEFPEYENAEQYFDGALDVVNNPPEGTLTKTAANGDNLIYDPISNTFAVQSSNGQIRTMFRPSDGLDYWNRQ